MHCLSLLTLLYYSETQRWNVPAEKRICLWWPRQNYVHTDKKYMNVKDAFKNQHLTFWHVADTQLTSA